MSGGGALARAASWLVDVTARRPAGWIGRKTYGGAAGAPPDHEQVFDRVLDALGPVEGERVLEIGCGGGRLVERLLAGGAERVGALDHSREMVLLTALRNGDALGRLRLRVAEAGAIPWPERSFDVAVSANMFFFVPEPERALAELARVLRPGGRLAIATTPGPLPKPGLRTWWVAVWGRALNVHTDERMRAMLAAAGFEEIRVESEGTLQLAVARRAGATAA